MTVRGHGWSIKNKGSQSLLLCKLLKRRIKLSKNTLFSIVRSNKALLKNRITVSFIHQRQGANERITLNGQPELAAILFIAGGYVQQIRLFLKRKIYLCLIVLDAQNQVDDLLFVFFLISDYLHVMSSPRIGIIYGVLKVLLLQPLALFLVLRNIDPFYLEDHRPGTVITAGNHHTVIVCPALHYGAALQCRINTSVYAEAAFYDLSFSVKKEETSFTADTADVPMAYALQGTDWEIGTVNVSTKRTWTSTENNALSILRQVQNLHGGDLIFDNANKTVSLLTFSGTDSGALFCYKKNMKSIQRVIDTTGLITRLYAVGADGMTFANINDGKAYVEDYSYTNEVRIKTLDCSSFTNPYQMLEFANMRLADYSTPRISYVLKAMDLTVLTGYEHESWNLGDTVMVADEDLDLSIKTRIVRREYNLQEPWNTVLELSTTLRELGDTTAQWDAAADTLEGANYIDNQQLQNFVPFNHLKNSRADSNFSYWTNSGFSVDTDNGVTGTASFKCEGAAGITKYMEQTVTPSNRDSYTFSAQIATENLSLGSSGQVGVEIVIEYEDGSTETRTIDLISSSDSEE